MVFLPLNGGVLALVYILMGPWSARYLDEQRSGTV